MTTFESVAVIGLGLIGGSIARDLAALGVEVRAYDADETQLAPRSTRTIVTRALDASFDGIRGVDAVIIAVPVDAADRRARRIAAHAARCEADHRCRQHESRASSTRRASWSLGDRFVGSGTR